MVPGVVEHFRVYLIVHKRGLTLIHHKRLLDLEYLVWILFVLFHMTVSFSRVYSSILTFIFLSLPLSALHTRSVSFAVKCGDREGAASAAHPPSHALYPPASKIKPIERSRAVLTFAFCVWVFSSHLSCCVIYSTSISRLFLSPSLS